MADDSESMATGPMPEQGASQSPPAASSAAGGGGMPPPMSGGSITPVAALGKQAELRNKLKAVVMILQRDAIGGFEFNSPEGKAIHKALGVLGPVFGGGSEEDKAKNSAMIALRQRAMQQRGQGGMGTPAMSQGSPSPQPNTGPIPSMAAGGMQ